MSQRTRTPPVSSRAFDAAFILEPEPSRALAVWWLALHVLVAASVLASGLALPLKVLAAAALIAHARLGRRSAPTTVLRRRTGEWALPERGAEGLELSDGTSVGPCWIFLCFDGPDGRISLLLLEDQLDRESWRALQAELRRGGAAGPS